jgi:hypothetical protein
MTTEPTEDDARLLLAKAAATIEVEESAPMTLAGLPEPRVRRWPVLAAAAAVVLAIGGGYLVAQQLGDDPQPAPAIDQTDAADREPVEQEHIYAADEMPSLLGYLEDEATELLESRGYPLEVHVEHRCDQPAGYVLGTDPGPGTPMRAGDSVTVSVTGGPAPNVRCRPPSPTWQQVFDLARFARGFGPPPAFPNGVSIAVGEGEYVELTAEEAADPERWVLCDDGECHSALAALEQILTEPVPMDRYFPSTSIVLTDNLEIQAIGPEPLCLTPDPLAELDVFKYHLATYVYVDYPKDFISLCPPPPVVQVEWTEDYRIASVRLRLAVESETIDEEELEGNLDRFSAAERFATWARGDGPAPEFADRVRVLQGGAPPFGAPTWLRDPTERSSYSMCSGLPPGSCAIDPIYQLDHYDGSVVPATGRALCVEGTDDLPPYLAAQASEDLIRLTKPEPPTCQQDLPVELWIDDDGVIYAVNLAGPPGT